MGELGLQMNPHTSRKLPKIFSPHCGAVMPSAWEKGGQPAVLEAIFLGQGAGLQSRKSRWGSKFQHPQQLLET